MNKSLLDPDYTKRKLNEWNHSRFQEMGSGISGSYLHTHSHLRLQVKKAEDFRLGRTDPVLDFAYIDSPFGLTLIVFLSGNVFSLEFVDRDSALSDLKRNWPQVVFRENAEEGQTLAQRIFSREGTRSAIALVLKGSPFQLLVWNALLTVPEGSLISYGQLAERMGRPSAVRAVARAVAANPVGYLVPCHRVIKKNGDIHQFRWGRERKARLIVFEAQI